MGIGGAGKTSLAQPLADRIQADYIALDKIAWSKARRVPDAAVTEALGVLLRAERWVIDGTLVDLLARTAIPLADHVIWIDTPRFLAARRILRRGAKWGPAAARVCLEAGGIRRRARRVLRSAASQGGTCVRLSSPSEVDSWLAAIG
jgi:adenylate kinase family enzyme